MTTSSNHRAGSQGILAALWHRWSHPLVVMGLMGALASCAPTGQESTAPSSPEQSALEAADQCSTFELRSPSGNVVDLTGSWISEHQLVYYAFQAGDCVWMGGGFETSTTPDIWRFGGMGPWTTSFRGHVNAQFRVVGDWADVRTAGLVGFNRGWGTATYQIGFTGSGTDEGMVLHAVDFTGHLEDSEFTFLGGSDIPP